MNELYRAIEDAHKGLRNPPICWNTGCLYSAMGQRITAIEMTVMLEGEPHMLVCFKDYDRHIDGYFFFTHDDLGMYYTGVSRQRAIQRMTDSRYLHNNYTPLVDYIGLFPKQWDDTQGWKIY